MCKLSDFLSDFQNSELQDSIRGVVYGLTDPTIGKQAWEAMERLAENPTKDALETVQGIVGGYQTTSVQIAVSLTLTVQEYMARLCKEATEVADELAKEFSQPSTGDDAPPDAA